MTDYDTIIIGAGNAGLVAATKLAQSGQKTLLLERHNIPGGCATSFIRGRFEFEVSLHQLSGVGTEEKPGNLGYIFRDINLFERLDLVFEKELYRSVSIGKVDIRLPADRESTIKVLCNNFPDQVQGIKHFFELIYKVTEQNRVVASLAKGRIKKEDAIKDFPDFLHYAQKTVADVLAEIITCPRLSHVLTAYWSYIGVPPSKMQFANFAILLWSYLEYKPVHFKGGSQALSGALLDAYYEAGGEAHFGCGVKQILVKDNQAYGVVTEHDETKSASNIISNASSLTTYYDLITPSELPKEIEQDYSTRQIGPSAFTLYMGMSCTPEALGIEASTSFITSTLDDEEAYRRGKTLEPPLYVCMSCYNVADETFSPEETCHIALLGIQYADPWLKLEPEEYNKAKYQYAEYLLDLAEKCHPDIRQYIEEVDVATPLTYMRYLGHPGGAIYGFDQTILDNSLVRPKQNPIKNLYLAGSWAGAGGYEPTLASGFSVARTILR